MSFFSFFQGQILEIKLLFWVLKHSLKYLPPPPHLRHLPPFPLLAPTPPTPQKIGSTSHVSLLYVDVQCNDMAVKKKKKAIKKFEHFINGSNITFSSMSVVSVEGGGRGACMHSRVSPNSTHWLCYLCEFSCAASASFKQRKEQQKTATQQHVYKLVSLF